ncbi:MAG: BamA/TamA family outer membrane protein [Deltaproteobacteria bacterium]|nr:BamA/TamA family outer membrane protein [Deltaproteobacteria bacterium]
MAGCSSSNSSSRPRRPGDERLKAIHFEGNKHLREKTLVTGLALHRTLKYGRAPDPYLMSVDAERIRGEYLRRGFLDADVRSRTDRKGDDTTVTYTVEEGVRATTRVVIKGLPQDVPPENVRAVLALKDGDPFNYATYELAKDPLRIVVEDAGYAHVQLEAEVIADRANHTAVIALTYTPGPKSVFGKVEITGVDGKLRDAVESRMQLAPGQPYSTSALVASQQQLYGLGRFSTVRVQPVKEGGHSVIDVKVDVAEGSKREIKLGIGAGMDSASYEARARAGYTIVGWPFQMHTFSLDLRPAYARLRDTGEYEPRIRAIARDERQDLFWTYARGIVEGGWNYLAVEAYTSYGPRAKLGFETPVKTDKVKLRLGWSIERLRFRRISPLIDEDLQARIGIGLDEIQQVGAYEQSVIVDLRDHPTNTRYGVYGEVRVAEGTPAAGGKYSYIQLVPELRGYVPLGPVVFAARARWGRFFGQDVPATERFFSGGSVSQRGFSERRLAPQVRGDVMGTTTEVPYGGTSMFESGVETRFPIMKIKDMPLGGVVFLDGADVVEEPARLSLSKLHLALGFGLRLHTIVGPLRFDFGYRLNRTGGMEPAPDDKFAFHLSLGEAF